MLPTGRLLDYLQLLSGVATIGVSYDLLLRFSPLGDWLTDFRETRALVCSTAQAMIQDRERQLAAEELWVGIDSVLSAGSFSPHGGGVPHHPETPLNPTRERFLWRFHHLGMMETQLLMQAMTWMNLQRILPSIKANLLTLANV